MKIKYLVLAFLGITIPYYFLISFLAANGFHLKLMLEQLFASNISTFFAVDVIISVVVFIVYLSQSIATSGKTIWWLFVLPALLVGVSFALPLFLFVQKASSENQPA